MKMEVWDCRGEGSLEDSRLEIYRIDYSKELAHNERPLVLLCPGGGYEYTSDREADLMAVQFLAMGYHAAVLRYSCKPAVYPTALCELARSVAYLRSRAQEWHINPDQIIVEGCSAGGHLAASLGVFWNGELLAKKVQLSKESIRPNALLLCYPVITSGEYAHRGSFDCLLQGIATPELLREQSLEYAVNSDVPPVFLWHTYQDNAVPVENSLLFVSALRKHNIPVEFHMYEWGYHGLALANEVTKSGNGGGVQEECTSWLALAHTWLEKFKSNE